MCQLGWVRWVWRTRLGLLPEHPYRVYSTPADNLPWVRRRAGKLSPIRIYRYYTGPWETGKCFDRVNRRPLAGTDMYPHPRWRTDRTVCSRSLPGDPYPCFDHRRRTLATITIDKHIKCCVYFALDSFNSPSAHCPYSFWIQSCPSQRTCSSTPSSCVNLPNRSNSNHLRCSCSSRRSSARRCSFSRLGQMPAALAKHPRDWWVFSYLFQLDCPIPLEACALYILHYSGANLACDIIVFGYWKI